MNTLKKRLLARRVIQSNGCWYLCGVRDPSSFPVNSVGRPTVGIKINGKKKIVNVAKAVDLLGLVKGEGPVIRHKCDDGLCWRPSHLIKGTYQDNSDDKVRANRQHRPIGKLNGRYKITSEQRQEMMILRSEGWTQKRIGDKYKVTQAQVSRILLYPRGDDL